MGDLFYIQDSPRWRPARPFPLSDEEMTSTNLLPEPSTKVWYEVGSGYFGVWRSHLEEGDRIKLVEIEAKTVRFFIERRPHNIRDMERHEFDDFRRQDMIFISGE